MTVSPQSNQVTIEGKDYQLTAFYFPGYNTSWDNYYNAAFFGNFWPSNLSLKIGTITANFHNAEAAFQATKWWKHDHIREQFENAVSGNEAFSIKKHLSIPADYSYAGLGRDGAMKAVLHSKFSDPNLQKGLMATGDAYLLEHNVKSGRDSYWSDDHNGAGKNMLGMTLMSIRQGLGGSGNPYDGPVINMTKNVQIGSNIKATNPAENNLKIIPSVFHGDGQDGDFGWMIKQEKYKDAFFIFNDNRSQFEAHVKDGSGITGCSAGGGNAVIRPYQCQTPPKAGGIPTGPGFSGLTTEVQSMIDQSIEEIKKGIKAGSYSTVVYSSNGHGGLGTSIFHVPDDVKKYIVENILSL